MANVGATLLALFAVLLAIVALIAISIGNLKLAGFGFISVSIVVYFRETRAVAD